MTLERLDCDCGHRLALHTYFKDRNPCTRCHCSTFVQPRPPVPFRARPSRPQEDELKAPSREEVAKRHLL